MRAAAREPGQRADPAAKSDLVDFFLPWGTLGLGKAAVGFVGAASEMAVAVFLLDTTRGGCCGGDEPLSTLLARCQETRSAPCLCASKFHCLLPHPTLGPAAAWLLVLSLRRGLWGSGPGDPAPRFSRAGRAAEPWRVFV